MRDKLKNIGAIGLLLCTGNGLQSGLAADAKKLNYEDHVKPILREHCFNCHNPDKKKADLDLTTYEALLIGGSGGEVVSTGDAESSTLWLNTAHQEKPYMPPKKPKIPANEIKLISDWIANGLKEHSGSKARVAKTNVNLPMPTSQAGKPDGPPPMPEVALALKSQYPLQTGYAPSTIATSPWAPLAAFGYPHQIYLYHTTEQRVLGILPFAPGHVSRLKFNRSGTLLIAAGGKHAKSGQVVIYNIKTGEASPPIADELDAILAADLSSDQKYMAIGSTGGTVKVIDLAANKVAYTIRKKHTDWITDIAFSPDGESLASSDRAGNLFMWYAQDGQLQHNLKGHKKGVTRLFWRGDSQGLASTDKDGYLFYWHINGKLTKKVRAHKNRISDAVISPQSKIATASYDGTIRTYDLNGKTGKSFKMNEPLMHIAWSGENLIASTSTELYQLEIKKGKTHPLAIETR